MVDYGLTDEGFSTKTYEVLLDELETEERSTMDPELDLSCPQRRPVWRQPPRRRRENGPGPSVT